MNLLKIFDYDCTGFRSVVDDIFIFVNAKFVQPLITYQSVNLYSSEYVFNYSTLDLDIPKNVFQQQKYLGRVGNKLCFQNESTKRTSLLSIFENGLIVKQIKGFEFVTTVDNHFVFQDNGGSIWDINYTKNKFLLLNSTSLEIKEFSKEVLLIDKIDSQHIIAKNKVNLFKCFNIETEEVKWELNFGDSGYFGFKMIGNKLFFFESISKIIHVSSTGQELWQCDLSAYLGLGKKITNVKADESASVVIVHTDHQLIGIDQQTGKVLWQQQTQMAFNDFEVDSIKNCIYVFDYYAAYRQETIYYYVISTVTGQILNKIALDADVLQLRKKYSEWVNVSDFHLGGCYQDHIYFAIWGYGMLYKIHKATGELVQVYIHEKGFRGKPQIHQNHLFLIEDDDQMKRLLIFELC